MARDYKNFLSSPKRKVMVVVQVYNLEKQIDEDLMLFPQEYIKIIHFQSFSSGLVNELSLGSAN